MKAAASKGSGPGQLEAWNCGLFEQCATFRCDGVHQSKQIAALKPDPSRGTNQTNLLNNIDNI